MVRDRYAGFFHLLIFWGFVVLLLRSLSLILEGLFVDFHLTEMLGVFGLGYQTTKDIFEVLVLVGVILAGARRLFFKPDRLHNSWDAWATLSFIGGLMVADLMADGAFIAMYHPSWQSWAPAGSAVAAMTASAAPQTLQLIYTVFWWAHMVLLFGFLNFLPYSKHFHVLTVVFNVFFRALEPSENIKRMDLEAEHFGINRIQDLTWKEMLDLYTCTECGRCEEQCPADTTGKPLSPKSIIHDGKVDLFAQAQAILAKEYESDRGR